MYASDSQGLSRISNYMYIMCIFSLPGVVGTAKAVIAESSTDKTQALGMSLIMGAFSLGLVIGPAVSGALADPIGQYNLTISGTCMHVCTRALAMPASSLFPFATCVAAHVQLYMYMYVCNAHMFFALVRILYVHVYGKYVYSTLA